MVRLPVLLLVFYVTVNAQECPTIISRSQWGGNMPTCKRLTTPVPNVIIHHTTGAYCKSRAACSTQVKNIQHYHIITKGWCDIGYNFLIGEDGDVYEGRGWTTQGSHATSNNHNSIGISFIGNFADRTPNTAALNAAKELITCGVAKNLIQGNYVLKAHRNVKKTECPGNSLYNIITNWPRFRG